ncbi:hypothetical protein [Paenibacillus sambharensis]|uniref:hypothetical protein n=1 Tax=Paenibacillus sambharensis TaxID=1803190 RepID=UPI0015E8A3E1|nr:hypothetical protein [Paenibacillus sambharensis]
MNVGALPLLPSATTLVEEFLDELIMDSPEKAYEWSTRPRGMDLSCAAASAYCAEWIW